MATSTGMDHQATAAVVLVPARGWPSHPTGGTHEDGDLECSGGTERRHPAGSATWGMYRHLYAAGGRPDIQAD